MTYPPTLEDLQATGIVAKDFDSEMKNVEAVKRKEQPMEDYLSAATLHLEAARALAQNEKDPALRYIQLQTVKKAAEAKLDERKEYIGSMARQKGSRSFLINEGFAAFASTSLFFIGGPLLFGAAMIGLSLWANNVAVNETQKLAEKLDYDLRFYKDEIGGMVKDLRTVIDKIEKDEMAGIDASPYKWRAFKEFPDLKEAFTVRASIATPAPSAGGPQAKAAGPSAR